MTVNALARKTQSSWRCVKSALQVLRDAEYVDQTGRKFVATEKVAGESFILNLRDSAADALFRWKATRALLYQLYLKPNSSLRELSYMLGLPYRTVKAVARKLKKVGLISGGTVNPQLIVRSASPLEIIPRRAHRDVIRHFLSALKTYCSDFNEAIVLFGKASYGERTIDLDLAVIFKEVEKGTMFYVAEKAVLASENVTSNYGAKITLSMCAAYAWVQMKLDIVHYDNPALRSLVDGICVYGELPSDDELFELGQALSPWPEEVIREKLEKGYLKPAGNGKYAYTEKAIKVFREKRSKVVESQIYIDGKKVRLIGVAPPHAL